MVLQTSSFHCKSSGARGGVTNFIFNRKGSVARGDFTICIWPPTLDVIGKKGYSSLGLDVRVTLQLNQLTYSSWSWKSSGGKQLELRATAAAIVSLSLSTHTHTHTHTYTHTQSCFLFLNYLAVAGLISRLQISEDESSYASWCRNETWYPYPV